MKSPSARLIAGVLLLCLCACASPPQTRRLLDNPQDDTLPRRAELTDVPYYAQQDYQCGPASLAMSLTSAGITVKPETLKPQIYLPGRHGSLQTEMLAVTRRYGAVAYRLRPLIKSVFQEIADGTPVIILQNLGYNWYPFWHYAVVIGYDLDRAEVILRSGPTQRQVLPLRTFEYTWARAEYWAMVTLTAGKIPASAEADAYVAAVSDLETSGDLINAQLSYHAATVRWPENLAAQMGVGNTAYRMHDLIKAESAFLKAANRHPDSVAALNNLAQTQSDLERYEEALITAKQAASMGGPLLQMVLQTLAEVERKSGH